MGWRSVPIGRIVVRLVDIAYLEPGETPHGVGFLCDFGYGIIVQSVQVVLVACAALHQRYLLAALSDDSGSLERERFVVREGNNLCGVGYQFGFYQFVKATCIYCVLAFVTLLGGFYRQQPALYYRLPCRLLTLKFCRTVKA